MVDRGCQYSIANMADGDVNNNDDDNGNDDDGDDYGKVKGGGDDRFVCVKSGWLNK